MQAIKCELCGSNQLIKKDGYYQCEFCGTKYTLEEAKKLIVSGTVEVVTGNAEKERLLKNAETFLKVSNIRKAIETFSQVTENYPNAPEGYQGILTIMANYGIGVEYTARDITGNFANDFKKTFNTYKIISNTTDTFQIYSNTLFNNICNGNIIILDSYGLSGVLSESQISFISTTGKSNADAVNELNIIEEILDNPPLNSWCKFYFGKSLYISYHSSSYDYDGSTSIFKAKKIADNEALLKRLKEKYISENRCQHCGGTFKGMFNKVCSKCGKTKDY